MAPATACQVCFELRKCRVKYLGKQGAGFVCTNVACLETNAARKVEAKTLADAEKAAAKKASQEAKAKERAAILAAKARARLAGRQSPRDPRATPFYRDPDAVTDEVTDKVTDEPDGEGDVLLRTATPLPEARSTPVRLSSRPSSVRRARKPPRFVDAEAGASSSDGVEEEEDEGTETPKAMRGFVVEDHLSEEGASRSRARSTGAASRATPTRTSAACSIIGSPTSAAGAAPAAGERRSRLAYSNPGSPAGTPGGSRAIPDSAYGRARRRRRLVPDDEDTTPEGVRGSLSPEAEVEAEAEGAVEGAVRTSGSGRSSG